MSSLVVKSDLSDYSSDEECFPVTRAAAWSSIPVDIRRNRDFSDLMWSLVCRNCSYSVDADGFCVCTHNASGDKENNEDEAPIVPPLKRTLTALIDVTGDKPKVIEWMGMKKAKK